MFEWAEAPFGVEMLVPISIHVRRGCGDLRCVSLEPEG